ncbi:hypothetical protein ACMD2_13643, partial [Ananas comosus]
MTNEAITSNLIKRLGPFDVFEKSQVLVIPLRMGIRIEGQQEEAEGKAIRLANILECRIGILPTKYLGLSLSTVPPSFEGGLE